MAQQECIKVPFTVDAHEVKDSNEINHFLQPKSVAKPKKQVKKPAHKDTMGAFGNPLFEWGDE